MAGCPGGIVGDMGWSASKYRRPRLDLDLEDELGNERADEREENEDNEPVRVPPEN